MIVIDIAATPRLQGKVQRDRAELTTTTFVAIISNAHFSILCEKLTNFSCSLWVIERLHLPGSCRHRILLRDYSNKVRLMTGIFSLLKCLACVLLFVLVANAMDARWVTPTVAYAQDEPEAKPVKKEAESHSGGNENFVWWVIKTSGPIGLVLFGLSVYFIALTSRLFLELRPTVAMPPDLMQDIQQKMEKRDYKGVYTSIKERDCLFTKVVAAGMGELSAGLDEARDSMERVADVQVVEMEKKISMLAVLGTLGPMIGLLGTLQGMITSFAVIASSDTQIKSSQVAHGILEALLLTFEGVALSVPAIYFFAVFKNRVMSIAANTTLQADEFLKKLAQAAKAAASAPKPAPTAPQPPKEQPKA